MSVESEEKVVWRDYLADLDLEGLPEGQVRAVVSKETIDIEGDVIVSQAWTNGLERFRKNPQLLWGHRSWTAFDNIGMAVGSEVTSRGLEMVFQYDLGSKYAQEVFRKVKEGFIRAFSVGFKPLAWISKDSDESLKEPYMHFFKSGARRVFTEVELCEVSQVLLPANAEALIVRSYEQRRVPDDEERLKELISLEVERKMIEKSSESSVERSEEVPKMGPLSILRRMVKYERNSNN